MHPLTQILLSESLDASINSIIGDTGCIRLLLNWSRRMHPVTIKMESPDASGDSRKMAHHGDYPLTVRISIVHTLLISTSILELSKLQRLVKSYYHTKFQASSSKIDRFMAILVHDPPLTPLNHHL